MASAASATSMQSGRGRKVFQQGRKAGDHEREPRGGEKAVEQLIQASPFSRLIQDKQSFLDHTRMMKHILTATGELRERER